MSDTSYEKVSTKLAAQSLQEASDEVRSLEDDLARAKDIRDKLIQDAYGTIGVLKLAKITRLSRESIYRITHSGD